ncbi:MAG: LCP family protein [Spirochaetota bacterium]
MRKQHRLAATTVIILAGIFAILAGFYFFFVSSIGVAHTRGTACYFSLLFTKNDGMPSGAFIGAFGPAAGRIGMVSIPDSMGIWDPHTKQLRTMPEWYRRGGHALVFDAVSHTFRMPLHYKIVVTEKNLSEIVDLMGGVRAFVDVDLAPSITNIRPFPPGVYLLDGARAVRYINAVQGENVSRERMYRLEDIVINLFTVLAQEETMRSIFSSVPFKFALSLRVRGNIRPVDYNAFAKAATNFSADSLIVETMSGEEADTMLTPVLGGRHAVKTAKDIITRVKKPRGMESPMRSDVKLSVHNATEIDGLADRIKIRMNYRGFQANEYGNFGARSRRTFVLVRNGELPKGFLVAEAARTALICARTDRRLLVDASLVLGDDYYEIAKIIAK